MGLGRPTPLPYRATDPPDPVRARNVPSLRPGAAIGPHTAPVEADDLHMSSSDPGRGASRSPYPVRASDAAYGLPPDGIRFTAPIAHGLSLPSVRDKVTRPAPGA